jgi:hypothetical protein
MSEIGLDNFKSDIFPHKNLVISSIMAYKNATLVQKLSITENFMACTNITCLIYEMITYGIIEIIPLKIRNINLYCNPTC